MIFLQLSIFCLGCFYVCECTERSGHVSRPITQLSSSCVNRWSVGCVYRQAVLMQERESVYVCVLCVHRREDTSKQCTAADTQAGILLTACSIY